MPRPFRIGPHPRGPLFSMWGSARDATGADGRARATAHLPACVAAQGSGPHRPRGRYDACLLVALSFPSNLSTNSNLHFFPRLSQGSNPGPRPTEGPHPRGPDGPSPSSRLSTTQEPSYALLEMEDEETLGLVPVAQGAGAGAGTITWGMCRYIPGVGVGADNCAVMVTPHPGGGG